MQGAPLIAMLHGCNLNMLGKRSVEHYGDITLDQLEKVVVDNAKKLGFQTICFQTNHEGVMVEKIHELRIRAAGMIINPGAWTHYSYAIHDALEMIAGPVVEVHLSAIEKRKEEWRHHSVISDVCDLTITGKGVDGYREALIWLVSKLRQNQ
ncbi:MAG: 3-dehydroquinate dehydratase [Gaiellales bacterium]|nr:MAG: 3-dehydroquinate dehydratase [Gaiellales bacterium]